MLHFGVGADDGGVIVLLQLLAESDAAPVEHAAYDQRVFYKREAPYKLSGFVPAPGPAPGPAPVAQMHPNNWENEELRGGTTSASAPSHLENSESSFFFYKSSCQREWGIKMGRWWGSFYSAW